MTSDSELTAEQLLARLRSGDEKAWKDTYLKYRGKFISWARQHYGLSDEDYQDVVQESFAVLHGNISQGKLTTLNSSLETYFFAVGKNKIRDMYKKKGRQWVDVDSTSIEQEMDMGILEKFDREYNFQTVSKLLAQLGENCQRVLRLFYYNRYTMESIADDLGYESIQGAKNKKMKCLKQLRRLVGLQEI